MNRTIVDMKKLAAAGLRLFAKPPAGFSYPCELMRFLAPYLAVERLRDAIPAAEKAWADLAADPAIRERCGCNQAAS